MSFLVVQLLSGLGVALTIALTWMVGWSRTAYLASVEQAAARFRDDFPALAARGGAVDASGRAALLELGDSVGLVTVAGDRLVTRRLRKGDVRRAEVDGDQLTLRLADPTLPRVRLALAASEAPRWAERLGGQS